MAVTHTYTGNTRYRVEQRLFRKPLLVLQVEIRVKGESSVPTYRRGFKEINCTFWRDAQLEDLRVIKN